MNNPSDAQNKRSDLNNISVEMSQSSQGEGNTKSSPTPPRYRSWCFTLNNYDLKDIEYLICSFNLDECRYVFQEETGENGTKHLQGVVNFKLQKNFNYVKMINDKCHWERTYSLQKSIKYCQKAETRTGKIFSRGFNINPRIIEYITKDQLYEWQIELSNYLFTLPNARTIRWYYDEEGSNGKTAMMKYIYKNFNHVFLMCNGKKTDIMNMVLQSNTDPNICIMNLSRSNESTISYDCIESLKDGFIFSGKYEGGFKLIPNPHIIVFANFEPDYSKLSMDRWDVYTLKDKKIIKYNDDYTKKGMELFED